MRAGTSRMIGRVAVQLRRRDLCRGWRATSSASSLRRSSAEMTRMFLTTTTPLTLWGRVVGGERAGRRHTRFSLGNPATWCRPVALRPRLATGVPLRLSTQHLRLSAPPGSMSRKSIGRLGPIRIWGAVQCGAVPEGVTGGVNSASGPSLFGAVAHRIGDLIWPCVVTNSDSQGTIWPSSHPYRPG